MKIKNFLLACCLFALTQVSAQVVKSPSAFRMLQTASTLMEAKQLGAAEDYYKSGLTRAIERKDSYCQALANEGLANLYSKLELPEKAVTHYKEAIRLYKKQRQYVVVAVLENLLKSAQGIGDIYAGIEIGAKGIKLSVIDVKLSMDREYNYNLLMDTSINTDAATLTYQSEAETSAGLTTLMDIIKNRFKIPSNKVYAVISSGLKQELDRYKKVDYFATVIRPVNMDSSIKISSVTPVEEAELSVLGIVPQKQRYSAGQLDVGSGNTKGGFFTADKVFTPFTFALGTKSFQRLVEYHGGANDIDKTAERLLADSLAQPLKNAMASNTEIKLKDVVYLSGGIVWSIVSLLHPESANKSYTELSASDIADFRKRIVTNYDELTKPSLSAIYNTDDAKAASKNISKVLKTYDRKAITSGAVLLNHLVQEMSSYNPSKKFIYFKYAYVGWISGYILKKVTKQYI